MPKSRHRKAHKEKRKAYRQSIIDKRQLQKKRQKEMMEMIRANETERIQKSEEERKLQRRELYRGYVKEQFESTSNALIAAGEEVEDVVVLDKLLDVIESDVREKLEHTDFVIYANTEVEEIYTECWPGRHKNVSKWYKLVDGTCIGINNPKSGTELVMCKL